MKDLILKNIGQLVSPEGRRLKKGKEMRELKVLENAFIVTENGKIKALGGEEVIKNLDLSKYEVIDCSGKTVLPGFVDSHTHFIFGGYRADEFNLRLEGASYMEIMEKGGGIASTTKATREASLEDFIELGRKRLKSFASMGVTTVEGKSGYGLDKDTELRQLEAMRKLDEFEDTIKVVTTYMGPHDIPLEFKGRNLEYIDYCLKEVLPLVKERDLADFCDIFTEKGVFTIEESRHFLKGCKQLGYRLKMHADEIAEGFKGAELAGEMACVSADHLLKISDEGIKALIEGGTCATMLPLTAFSIKSNYAPARKIIDMGGGLALATDFNPGSCYSESIPLIIALATIYMGMHINEVIVGLTLNGAAALGLAHERGSIEPGKYADLAIFDVPNFRFLSYHFGMNECITTISEGRIIYNKRD